LILRQLTLQHFRNYSSLDVIFEPGLIVLQGDNAQGKTNLLEAVYMLATTKSARARSDADLVSWHDRDPLGGQAFARIVGRVDHGDSRHVIEILVREGGADGPARKRFKVNGVERRAGEVLGRVNAVFFSPEDVDIVAGGPSQRRRFLDIMLCQVNAAYVRSLNRYGRAVLQRNALLRQVRDRQQPVGSLEYWDTQVCELGAQILSWRAAAVTHLARAAAVRQPKLTGGQEHLEVRYKPGLMDASDVDRANPADPLAALVLLKRSIERAKSREIAVGVSMVGPHRDDLALTVNEMDVTAFGSRGQQRTAALALKLAELEYIREHTGDYPLLLLDDAASELDERRRAAVLQLAGEARQTFVTSASVDMPGLPPAAQRWSVVSGSLRPLA
jgi:DNA replication and repair protein RecF